MHSGALADPLNDNVKQLKKISSKRDKTDSDFEQMAKLEFIGSLYSENNKAIIPTEIIEANIVAAARKTKKGKVMLSAIFATKNTILNFQGEQDLIKRFDNSEYRYTVSVCIQRARIMRTRPIFRNWSANIEIEYDNEQINLSELKDIIKTSGDVGIMDYRPKFGRFKVEFL